METNNPKSGLLSFGTVEFGLQPVVLIDRRAGAGFTIQKNKAAVPIIEGEPGFIARQRAISISERVLAVMIAARVNNRGRLGRV